MKFSEAAKGTRAERVVTVDLARGKHTFAIRPLTGNEEAEALAGARDFTKSKGSVDPKPGDPLFELGIAVHTIAIGCVDVDSPETARAPYFDGGAPQILGELAREEIAYLYERHAQWQDECSPTVSKLQGGELIAELIRQVEAEDDGPFVRLRPAVRWHLLRTTARLCLSSPELRSELGWPVASESSPTTSTH